MKYIIKRMVNSAVNRQLKRWDSQTAINDGYSVWARLVNNEPAGQFAMCPVYVTDMAGQWEGTWAENQMATPLTNAEWNKIADYQTSDEYNVGQKMNCLSTGGNGQWGEPIKATYPDPSMTNWRFATNIKMIASVYADGLVQVIGRRDVMLELNGRKEITPISEIKTYQPSEWNNPWAWQVVTGVNTLNVFQQRVKGIVKLPIYFGNRRAFVLDRWLV